MEMQEQQQNEVKQQPVSVRQSLLLTTSSAVPIEIAAMIAHNPTVGVLGVIAGMVAWRHGPQMWQGVSRLLPENIQGVIEEVSHPVEVRLRRPKASDEPVETRGKLYPDDQEKPTALREDEEIDDYAERQPLFPDYPEDETLRLGRVLTTGERFDPHFNALLGKGWVAAANQGFGKSVLNGLIIESAGRCGLPVIVLDHKGEYHTIKQLSFMNTLLVGNEGSDYILQISDDPEETASDVDALIDFVMKGRYQAIINLPSYGTGWLGKATISAAIGQGLMRYAEQQRKLRQTLLPCLVIMDEAQLYLPQDQTLLPPEALENKAVLAELKNAYFALVSNGRSAGYTLGFATQSLTYLAKWAIKSSQVRIFGRHAEKNDLDMCESIINPMIATRKDIEVFPPGVGVVFGLTEQPMIVQFDRKLSRDESETPNMQMLRKRPVEQRVHVQPSVAYAANVTPLRQRPSVPPVMEDFDAMPKKASPPLSQAETTGHFTSSLSKEQRVALKVYSAGMSYRELAAAMTQAGVEIGKDKAGEIVKQLKAKRLIA